MHDDTQRMYAASDYHYYTPKTTQQPWKPAPKRPSPWVLLAWVLIVIVIAASLVTIVGVIRHHAPAAPVGASASAAVTHIASPETASQFASAVSASAFVNAGPSELGGVITSGTAVLGGGKVGIDCFATNAAMKSWLQMAASEGVAPQNESSTCVEYPSTDSK